MFQILLCFDKCEGVAQPLIVHDRGMVDSLILAENPVGKHDTFPPDLQGSVVELVELNILTR